MSRLEYLNNKLQQLADDFTSDGRLAAANAGIWQDGETVKVASGIANLNTGESMKIDTRWLLGSITKVLTAQLVLQFARDGRLDLNRPVISYLPDFSLTDAAAASAITVGQLIDHSNGIDSDTYAPATDDIMNASRHYVRGLRKMGVLFASGSGIHYSNPGFIIAAYLLETISGINFNRLLKRDLFEPCGMTQALTSAQDSILYSTAIGAFAGDHGLVPTRHFMSVASGAGAGTTAIVTLDDMLRFAAIHLAGDPAVPATIVSQMQQVQGPVLGIECKAASVSSGYGWWLDSVRGHRCLSHGGGSPGGVANLALFPDLRLGVVSFATGPAVLDYHDAVLDTALEAVAGSSVSVAAVQAQVQVSTEDGISDLDQYCGVYSAFQTRHTVTRDGKNLRMVSEVPPFDTENEAFLLSYYGRLPPPLTRQLQVFKGDTFMPEGTDPSRLDGLFGRLSLWAFERNASGEIHGLRCGARFSRRENL